jgi:hypothetical protein
VTNYYVLSFFSIDYVNKDKGKAQLEDFVFSPSASKTTATVSATTTADRPKTSAFPVG